MIKTKVWWDRVLKLLWKLMLLFYILSSLAIGVVAVVPRMRISVLQVPSFARVAPKYLKLGTSSQGFAVHCDASCSVACANHHYILHTKKKHLLVNYIERYQLTEQSQYFCYLNSSLETGRNEMSEASKLREHSYCWKVSISTL